MNVTEQGIALYLGEERLRFLQTITVGIAGAGGLGSNCAMHLVRSGFRKFVIADFDRLEASNLNRQAYSKDQVGQLKVRALAANMLAVNPDLEIDLRTNDVTPDNMAAMFMSCDAVVEAFDDPSCKKVLVETYMPSDKLVVAASGIGGYGSSDDIRTRRIRDNFFLIGDMETECSMEHPPMSPKVGVAAAKQADAVLSYYLEQYEKQGGA
ncbi:sulfur carrier protein ThiS adenylyltransferase ThiF [Pseudodesulfovibrio sp. zrk46]|uniref:sulfur carrier protein ThiS adenylyltransferase ThiF n=1 Tax=Pseudodesulfovibrio sp. zrk46 TaxID=2725288 RepID=UPI001449983E|nr:sulfur carrier protein ThiS adenylyltransferase ThiF [Pseudodesulfovibrio sp. zrk46]QJB54914.1 sulfur carrier protein ThiS adenylyltransferase ThiF [Pseudodesulfovibrio sp. zrk46]